MRSSFVETSSSASSFAAVFLGNLCAASAANGAANVEVAMADVPARKLRRELFIIPSLMRMRAAGGADAHEQYNPCGMASVDRGQKIRLAVEHHLRAQRGRKPADERNVTVVSHRVGLNAGEKLFLEARR